MPPKAMMYKDEDGKEYKISFSEELQMKNLRAARENTKWLRMNFYAKIVFIMILVLASTAFMYLLYRLDVINFFTGLLYSR
ncbi:MAG: hypothetical protein AABW41_04440 [Nanoarchaeota archaeon]